MALRCASLAAAPLTPLPVLPRPPPPSPACRPPLLSRPPNLPRPRPPPPLGPRPPPRPRPRPRPPALSPRSSSCSSRALASALSWGDTGGSVCSEALRSEWGQGLHSCTTHRHSGTPVLPPATAYSASTRVQRLTTGQLPRLLWCAAHRHEQGRQHRVERGTSQSAPPKRPGRQWQPGLPSSRGARGCVFALCRPAVRRLAVQHAQEALRALGGVAFAYGRNALSIWLGLGQQPWHTNTVHGACRLQRRCANRTAARPRECRHTAGSVWWNNSRTTRFTEWGGGCEGIRSWTAAQRRLVTCQWLERAPAAARGGALRASRHASAATRALGFSAHPTTLQRAQ